MEASSLISPLPPLEDSPFEYGSTGFACTGISRVTKDRLVELLHPQSIKVKRDRNRAIKDAQQVVTKAWLLAQFQHYGIHLHDEARRPKEELQEILAQMVNTGRRDVVPSYIVARERELAARYKDLNDAHIASRRKQLKDHFSSLGSLTRQVNYSVPMFMSEYFLDEAGQPDKNKTPYPITLPDDDVRGPLYAAIQAVPGLEINWGGEQPRTMIIGWDRGTVWALADKITILQRREYWEESKIAKPCVLDKHKEFVEKVGKKSTNAGIMEGAVGKYWIQSKELEEGWAIETEEMNFTTSPHTASSLKGEFNLGVLEGVLFLAANKMDLSYAVSEAAKGDVSSDENDDEEEEEEDDDNDNDNKADRHNQSSQSTNSATTTTLKRKAPSTTAGPSTIKKARPLVADSKRLYLQWRGNETGEGVIEIDYDNSNVGYLDFRDPSCVQFSGVISVPCCGPKVQFEGYKISDEPPCMTREWSDYSEKAYEYARVARWG